MFWAINKTIKEDKYGKFYGCSNYPECTNKISVRRSNQ